MQCPTCSKNGYAKEPGYHCENCGTHESVHADRCNVPKLVPAVALLLTAVDKLNEAIVDDMSRRSLVFYCGEVAKNVRRILEGG